MVDGIEFFRSFSFRNPELKSARWTMKINSPIPAAKPLSVGHAMDISELEHLAAEAGFRVKRLTVLCRISERQMERYFARHFQTTPKRWLRGLQCRLAERLIGRGERTKAVASQVGFESAAHFCREFKKVYGTPPRSFGRHQVPK